MSFWVALMGPASRTNEHINVSIVSICIKKSVSVVKSQCLPLGLLGGFQSFKPKRVSSKTEKQREKKRFVTNVQSRASNYASNFISSCSIDLALQMFKFPHLSIHQEVLTI